MPFIQIETGKADNEQKEKLIAGFTKVASETLGIDAAYFYVLVRENDVDNWGVGGEPVMKFMQKNAKG